MNETKEEYRTNREAGLPGQGKSPKGQTVTPAEKVIQGPYGTRKARRAVEVHLQSPDRRGARRKAVQS